jgi:hypothetical protein
MQLKEIIKFNSAEESDTGPYSRPLHVTTRSAGFYVFVFLTAYVTAATVEEIIKATIVRCSCGLDVCAQARKSFSHPRKLAYATLALLMSASLGFSTCENLLYIFGESLASQVPPSLGAVGYKALIALIRGIVSMPVHCICVAFTALRLTLRDAQRNKHELLKAAAESTGIYQWVSASGSRQHEIILTAFPSAVSAPANSGCWLLVKDKSTAAQEARQAEAQIWSWPRVLWPSIAVHGTFDFQAMMLGAALFGYLSELKLTLLTLCLGAVVQAVSLYVLRQQYAAVFEKISTNDVPTGITLGVHWTLCGPAPAIKRTLSDNATEHVGSDVDALEAAEEETHLV